MERRCRVCGCTDDHACEGGCSWTEADLCSKCAEAIDQEEASDEEVKSEEVIKVENSEPTQSQQYVSGSERIRIESLKYQESGRGSGKEKAVAGPVAKALIEFCKNERFSEAVRTSDGNFEFCIKKIMTDVGNVISDLEVYQRAAAYYFPNATISFNMSIDLSGMLQEASEKQDHKRVDINLDELF